MKELQSRKSEPWNPFTESILTIHRVSSSWKALPIEIRKMQKPVL